MHHEIILQAPLLCKGLKPPTNPLTNLTVCSLSCILLVILKVIGRNIAIARLNNTSLIFLVEYPSLQLIDVHWGKERPILKSVTFPLCTRHKEPHISTLLRLKHRIGYQLFIGALNDWDVVFYCMVAIG